jgi:asparagine synthase (glutamine-hydrolysing)
LEGRLLLASEAKAFLAYGWQPEWDVASFRDNGWLCDDRTMFAGVRKVLPGQYLSLTSFSHMSQQKYWDLEFRPKVSAPSLLFGR